MSITGLPLLLVVAAGGRAGAHNAAVHRAMTDYAYEVIRAGAEPALPAGIKSPLHDVLRRAAGSHPQLDVLYARMAAALPKLQALQSGLTATTTACNPPIVPSVGAGGVPDWKLAPGATLEATPLIALRFPVTTAYGASGACGIDAAWAPSGLLKESNPVVPSSKTFTKRDQTGVALGYWAQWPDNELDDWHLRSTTLEVLQSPVVEGGVAAGVTTLAFSLCAIACGLFPPACAACPVAAVIAASEVIDVIEGEDASNLTSDDFVGFGHFIDMKATPPGSFDEKPGKLGDRAGPQGAPDDTENLVDAFFDLAGMHVNFTTSNAPKRYQIILGQSGAVGADFHRNSVQRGAADWEPPTIEHVPLTAVDNLAMFGWQSFERNAGVGAFPLDGATADATLAAKRLGWALHALGDASVPQHVVGASGFGHRPYEDAMEFLWPTVMGDDVSSISGAMVSEIVIRALFFQKVIHDWRAAHPGLKNDVPVRDLVTALAARTLTKAKASAAIAFQPDLSAAYIFDHDDATQAYEQTAGIVPFYRDRIADGIAAEVALLVAATEVTP